MKKWSAIAAVTAFAIFAVADMVHYFVTNDPIGYFVSEPRRLLYVAGIAIAGGLAASGFYRLSPHAQRWLGALSWGAAASAVTAFLGYFVFRVFSFFSFFVESGDVAWILLLTLLFFCGLAIYLWVEFCRAWKKGTSH